MVLDAGKLVEFDTPKKLLQEGGFLRRLVEESEDRDELLKLVGIEF